MAALILSRSEADGNTEEGCGKTDTIYPCGAAGFEIILTLLTKIVTIHVGFSGAGFQGLTLE